MNHLPAPFCFTVHNWRKFDQAHFCIPHTPLCIVDHNGSGKTSIIAALYSLLSAKAWPNMNYKQLVKSNTHYFGITAQSDWYINGALSSNGRMLTKYVNETDITVPVMTYLPTDNQWFFLSRTQKLAVLDTLLSQAFGSPYTIALIQLQKSLKQKTALLKRYLETGEDDTILATEYSRTIFDASTCLWQLRDQYFISVINQLDQFYTWIEAKHTFELQLLRTVNTQRLYIAPQQPISQPDFLQIWNKEKQAQKILFGAQRDDFVVMVDTFNSISTVLSRGEMRLFVLFLKYTALQLHPNTHSIVWLLDDIFNEFDTKREQVLFESILSQSHSFIATSTKQPSPHIPIKTVSELINPH